MELIRFIPRSERNKQWPRRVLNKKLIDEDLGMRSCDFVEEHRNLQFLFGKGVL